MEHLHNIISELKLAKTNQELDEATKKANEFYKKCNETERLTLKTAISEKVKEIVFNADKAVKKANQFLEKKILASV